MSAKILPLPEQARSFDTAEALTVRLRREMYHYDPKDLAEAAGVTVGTIYAIRSGRTKWPRGTTLFPILRAMGYVLVLRKSN